MYQGLSVEIRKSLEEGLADNARVVLYPREISFGAERMQHDSFTRLMEKKRFTTWSFVHRTLTQISTACIRWVIPKIRMENFKDISEYLRLVIAMATDYCASPSAQVSRRVPRAGKNDLASRAM